MAETAGALAQSTAWAQQAPVGGWGDVKNDIVRVCWVSGHPANGSPGGSEMVEIEIVTKMPGDHVIGTGRIATHADTADPNAALGQEH